VGRGLVVNSGCSNVAVAQGIADARQMTQWAAARLGVNEDETFVASTGVIGRRLPLDKLEEGIARVAVSRAGASDFARAMMTTDTVPKSRALRFAAAGREYTLGAAAKGVGMAHPNMATVLCFLTTDAPVSRPFLQHALKRVADRTLNMIDVDSDTSTSDTMLIFANGLAGGAELAEGRPGAEEFEQALLAISTTLARDLARDGEGARTLIEVVCRNAASVEDARLAARAVVSSPLVKTMVTGRDPNPGRVLMAVGRSGAQVDPARIGVWIGSTLAFQSGAPSETPYDELRKAMMKDEVQLTVDLGLGNASATAWGCDLTEEYVRINAHYTT
jgi:glutamate N-acetyltransferase/amino-acid N-acetyltransferase